MHIGSPVQLQQRMSCLHPARGCWCYGVRMTDCSFFPWLFYATTKVTWAASLSLGFLAATLHNAQPSPLFPVVLLQTMDSVISKPFQVVISWLKTTKLTRCSPCGVTSRSPFLRRLLVPVWSFEHGQGETSVRSWSLVNHAQVPSSDRTCTMNGPKLFCVIVPCTNLRFPSERRLSVASGWMWTRSTVQPMLSCLTGGSRSTTTASSCEMTWRGRSKDKTAPEGVSASSLSSVSRRTWNLS